MMAGNWLIISTIFVIIGLFAGLMAGALGIGGGLIVVPCLVVFFKYYPLIPQDALMHVAAASSLTIMVFTSLASLTTHARLGEILWPLFYKLWPGVVVGVCLGTLVAQYIPTKILQMLYGVFLLIIATKMLLDRDKMHTANFPNAWVNFFINFLSGVQSSFFGVGNGLIIIPYLTYCGVPPRKIPPVANLCTLAVALLGAVGCMLTGWTTMSAVSYTTGYVYWPAVLGIALLSSLFAPLGAKLNYILPVSYLKMMFIVILILTSVKMLS